jgi:hypothetical protein
MRGLGVWGIGVAFAVGMSVGVVSAADEATPTDAPRTTSSNNGWSKWFGGNKKVPEKKPAPSKAKESAAADSTARMSARTEDPAAERKREQATLFRRIDVCLKLMEIADETGDENLRRLAEDLDERAKGIYAQRIAHLPTRNAAFVSDEQILNKHLGSETAPPGQQESALTYSVTGKDATARATNQEEKP